MAEHVDYAVRERTVTVEAVLEQAQHDRIHRLLRRKAGRRPARAGYLFDLPTDRRGEAVLRFLREEGLPHVVSEERVWPTSS